MYWSIFLLVTSLLSFSYPYSEQHHEARSYLRARCPAWCDRILLSHSFKKLVDTKVELIKVFFFYKNRIISL